LGRQRGIACGLREYERQRGSKQFDAGRPLGGTAAGDRGPERSDRAAGGEARDSNAAEPHGSSGASDETRRTMTALPSLKAIRAVLFDLDGTLLDRASSLELFLNRQYDRFEASLSQIDRRVYVQTLIELDNHGYTPKTEAYAKAQEAFRIRFDLGQALLDDYEAGFHNLAIPFPVCMTSWHRCLQRVFGWDR
jgi:hypothetical protein